MMEFNRTGRVLRIQEVNPDLRNVAVRFDEPLPVGKVFFDTIGLYVSNQESQAVSLDDNVGEEKDPPLGVILEQRFNVLEQELAELKQLVLRNAEPGKQMYS